jgi:hypothetical protein
VSRIHAARLRRLEALRPRQRRVRHIYVEQRDTGGPFLLRTVRICERDREGDEPWVQWHDGSPPSTERR